MFAVMLFLGLTLQIRLIIKLVTELSRDDSDVAERVAKSVQSCERVYKM